MQLRTLPERAARARTRRFDLDAPPRLPVTLLHSLSAHLSTSSTQVGVANCLRFLAFSEQGLVTFLM